MDTGCAEYCPSELIDKENVMRYGVTAFVFCAIVAGVFGTRPAGAVKAFLEQFKAVYVKPKTSDYKMKVFNEAVQAKGCTICHHGQAAKPTKSFNAYGTQLKGLLNGKRDAGNPQKIAAAIKQVAAMKSNPADPKSPTFAKRLSQGKLPVGEITVQAAKNAAN